MRRPSSRPLLAYGLLLGSILLAGLYLRTANLTDVQSFNGDQGRDYLEVMKWVRQGQWPLLGPDRAVGDRALGPGWFYTIAPALALGRFHPAAGAAMVAVLSMLAIFCGADWVRRATGSRAAALVTAAALAFSALGVEMGRTLWNPHALPLGTAALAWLIALLPRRPLPCLAGALALMAILPQWHTTGFLVDAAALPFLALALRGAWPAARAAGRRAWALWGAALLAVVALLYVPPLVYELKPGPGNLATFFSKSNLPARPYPEALPMRALLALAGLAERAADQAFFTNHGAAVLGEPELGFPVALAAACGAAFVALWVGAARRRAPDWAAAYLALLTAGFWLVLFLKGSAVQGYYLIAVQPAPVLLAAWVAGRLIVAPASCRPDADAPSNPSAVRYRQLGGVALLLLAGALTLGQLPRAWAWHQGATPYGYSFRVVREVAEAIARDSGGRPYSMELAEAANFPGHYFYLLRRLGRPPLNGDYYTHAIERDKLGERTYIVVTPGMARAPELKGIGGPNEEPIALRNVLIYRIERTRLPQNIRRLKVEIHDDLTWTLEAVL